MTDSGATAARCGGCVPAVNSCVIPEKEIPAMPTLPPLTHFWAATVSTAS